MLRSTFFSAGLFVFLWGISFLFVDKIILTGKSDPRDPGFRGLFTANAQKEPVMDPPDWAAFSLMSIGAVTMLYAAALPRRPQ